MLLHEPLHKVLSVLELAGGEVRFLRGLGVLIEYFKLVNVHERLTCHPLEKLGIVYFAFAFDKLVISEAFLSGGHCELLHLNVVPNSGARISSQLVENLKHAFDELIELIETQRHRIVGIKQVESCKDFLIDCAATH